MKKSLFLIIALLILFGSFTLYAQDDVNENKNAPANYDANLKAGEKTVDVMFGSLRAIIIVSKSGGVYKAMLDDGTDNEYFFRANAVYPYFDPDQFVEITNANRDVITPYLGCYAEKRGANLEMLKGDGFHPPHFADVSELKQYVESNQAKLAEIEQKMKALAARPDTFLNYTENPAVWYEIVSKRAEYLPCAVGLRQKEDIAGSPWLKAHRDGIAKTLKAVNDYDPATQTSMNSDSEYALYAVSLKARTKWLTGAKALDFKEPVDALLAPLAATLAKKLPTYFSSMDKYSLGTAADFALLKRALTSPARYKIFKTGLMQNSWQIVTNSLGIPTARYKNGLIYLRDTQADHPYCHATYVNIIQDYAGGGRYAASRSRLVGDELVACPAGTK